MTVSEALRVAVAKLQADSDTARIDAELLMAHALGMPRSDMLLGAMANPVPDNFDELVERRAANEPVAYIIGNQEFHGLDLMVTPDVLIPRGDSETLIDAAQARFGADSPKRILDLGTGSGALLLAGLASWLKARGIGIDASDAAAAVARHNAEKAGVSERCEVRVANWREAGWADGLGRFDLILCNPPYVEDNADLDPDVREYEPASALFAGPDGLDDYRILIPQIRDLMAENAVAIFEIGHRQADSVTEIARENGFSVEMRRDLADRPRALILT